MMAFPQQGWTHCREHWSYFLDQFEIEMYPVFKERGYSKSAALQAYFSDVLSSYIAQSCDCDNDEDGGEGWKPPS